MRAGPAELLSLAATPTFAVMALATACFGSGPLEALCSAAAPVGGMVPMYALMALFHAAPWVRMVGRQSA